MEVLDLLASTCGPINTLAQKAYRGLVQFAPSVWGGVYACLDASPALGNRLGAFARLRNALADILHETQPDCVVSTYPAYGHAIAELFRDHAERGFRFLTVVTDSITVNAAWYQAAADFFCVPNVETAAVLRQAGIPDGHIKTFGFPVSPIFVEGPAAPLPSPAEHARSSVNRGARKWSPPNPGMM